LHRALRRGWSGLRAKNARVEEVVPRYSRCRWRSGGEGSVAVLQQVPLTGGVAAVRCFWSALLPGPFPRERKRHRSGRRGHSVASPASRRQARCVCTSHWGRACRLRATAPILLYRPVARQSEFAGQSVLALEARSRRRRATNGGSAKSHSRARRFIHHLGVVASSLCFESAVVGPPPRRLSRALPTGPFLLRRGSPRK
jgi:hypothetical protein